MYTRSDCPLCDDALAVLEHERRTTPFALEVVDIGGNAELTGLHGNDIPVVFINGTRRFFGHVDPVLFRRCLRAPRV